MIFAQGAELELAETRAQLTVTDCLPSPLCRLRLYKDTIKRVGNSLKQIPNDSIKKWAYSSSNKLSHPVSVAAVCPECSLNVVFNTKRRLYDPNRDTSSCSSDCPACNATVHFWVVDMVAHARQDGEGQPGVYMLPAPHEYMEMSDHEDTIPDSVLQYCKTAQDIYFSGNLMATNVLIKTALETVFSDFLPVGNSRGDLSKMIRDSISSINHNEPLAALTASTRKDGDLYTLFQRHHGTDQETADAMIQLLETLITYLYVIPAQFKELEARIADIRARIPAAEEESGTDDDIFDNTRGANQVNSNDTDTEDSAMDKPSRQDRVSTRASNDSLTQDEPSNDRPRYKHLKKKRDDGSEDQAA